MMGFVDLHSHILPYVDDGCKDVHSSLKLLKQAVNDGISHIVLTPHYIKGSKYQFDRQELISRYIEFKDMVKKEEIDVQLFLGSELYIHPDLDEYILDSKVCTYNNTQYVLVEFPFGEYHELYDRYLDNIMLNGYRIIIAHPERYKYVQKNVDFCKRWINKGCLLQGNQNSFFDNNEKVALKLLDKEYYSFIASDAHGEHRPCMLSKAYEKVVDKVGKEYADKLFCYNPLKVIKGE